MKWIIPVGEILVLFFISWMLLLSSKGFFESKQTRSNNQSLQNQWNIGFLRIHHKFPKKKVKSKKSSGSTIISIAFRTSRPSELLTAFQHLQHRSQLHRQSCLQRNELLTGPVEEPWPFHHAGRFLTHSYLRKTPICSTVQWLYECNCNCQAWIHWILYHIQSYGSVSKPCTPGEHQNSW